MNDEQETLRYELGYKVSESDPSRNFLMNIDVAIDGGNITKIRELCPEGFFSRDRTLSNFKALCESGYIDKQDYLEIKDVVDIRPYLQDPTMIVEIKN